MVQMVKKKKILPVMQETWLQQLMENYYAA